MTATGRTAAPAPADLASAGFVRLVARPDGDALAAAGLLARALAARETPFQVSVAETIAERTERASAAADADDELTVVIGPANGEAPRVDPADRPTSLAAVELVRELGERPDPVLALAGAVAAGVEPGAGETAPLLEAAREGGAVERRSGVAVPTADPIEGLAHSTLVRAGWSGDADAVADALGDVADDGRRLASLVALDAVGDDDATERAAETVGRTLHPWTTPGGPFATVCGTADVLEAAARASPGTGVALAIGHGAREAALDAWRVHGAAVHAAIDAASTARHDGLFVLRLDDGDASGLARDGAIESVARLAAATRSPEPVVLAVATDAIGVAVADDRSLGPLCERLARAVGADYDYGPTTGSLRDVGPEPDEAIETVRAER